MKYLPILEELFSSDSIFFLVIGLVLAAFVGVRMKDTKTFYCFLPERLP